MSRHPRLIIFSLGAAIGYTLAYYFEWSLFQYYLTDNRLFFFGQGEGEGPPILWYGWLGTAVVAGVVATAIIPPKLTARLPADLVWLLPLVMMFAALMYEKRWFSL